MEIWFHTTGLHHPHTTLSHLHSRKKEIWIIFQKQNRAAWIFPTEASSQFCSHHSPFLQMGQHWSGSYTGSTHSVWGQAETVHSTSPLASQRHLSHGETWNTNPVSHPLTASLQALLERAVPTFSSAMFSPSHLFSPRSKTNGFCGLKKAESKTRLLQNYGTTAGKGNQNKKVLLWTYTPNETVRGMLKTRTVKTCNTNKTKNYLTEFLMNFLKIKFIM